MATLFSVMAVVRVADVSLITQFACSGRGGSLKTRCIRKGELDCLRNCRVGVLMFWFRFVEQLENNQPLMVAGLQEMYKRMVASGTWEGLPLKESLHGTPLTHDILEKLGVLKKDHEGNTEYFEDDPEMIKVNLFAHGAQAMQRQGSEVSGSSSDRDHSAFNSPVFDNANPVHGYSQFSDYDITQTPPTPPTLSSPFAAGPRILSGYEYIQTPYMSAGTIHSSMDPMVLQQQFHVENKFGCTPFGTIDSPFRSTSTPDQLFMGATGDEDLQLFSR
ncbi:hypothetical protein FGG08_003241 [Glutinoglossum americanum]|uniref:Uncharacterized protein n=1 Tax=Glutinoglossum americanum TaxID=1670608 RepID=A0A9P8IBH5_9PEZI|nr:hypothetical protein FGG08_003241 [Glutinoglossum americanum]